tara:strand:- start:142 stop:333 length:192 start_codon:yes stop_codon:yes gene_type:complete
MAIPTSRSWVIHQLEDGSYQTVISVVEHPDRPLILPGALTPAQIKQELHDIYIFTEHFDPEDI